MLYFCYYFDHYYHKNMYCHLIIGPNIRHLGVMHQPDKFKNFARGGCIVTDQNMQPSPSENIVDIF